MKTELKELLYYAFEYYSLNTFEETTKDFEKWLQEEDVKIAIKKHNQSLINKPVKPIPEPTEAEKWFDEPKPKTEFITLNFYHQGVSFDDIDTLIRIYKTCGYSLKTVLEDYLMLNSTQPKYLEAIQYVKDNYETVKAFTDEEVMQNDSLNSYQKDVILNGIKENLN